MCVLLMAGVRPAGAQPVGAQAGAMPDSTRPVIQSVEIQGNTFFDDAKLKQYVRAAPNRRILGIPGFTWWRWMYQLGAAGTLGKRISRALREGGEPPAYVDRSVLQDDVERLRIFYQNAGFRDARVSVQVRPTDEDDRVRVVFRVAPGRPTYIRTITYKGLGALTPAQARTLLEETPLPGTPVPKTPALDLRLRSQRYMQLMLLQERRRLLDFLRNRGFAAITRDSVQAIVYRPVPDSFDVSLRVRPGARYRFGPVHVQVEGPEANGRIRRDTLRAIDGQALPFPVTIEWRGETHLQPTAIARALQFRPGALYRQSAVQATKRRLESIGVFSFTNFTPQFDAAVAPDSATLPALPLRIDARTLARHQLRAEMFALQRETVTDIENELGIGLGVTYENLNALGAGEAFQVGTSASIGTSVESITRLTSAQLEVNSSLTLPYLVRPFGALDSLFALQTARTRIALGFLRARRDEFRLRIRARANARLSLELNHSATRQSFIDVVDLSLSNPDTLRGFERTFLRRVIGTGDSVAVLDPVQRRQIIEDYTQPQINSALRYTLRSTTTDLLRRSSGHIYEGTAEVGNLLPMALDRFLFTPGRVEYSLPGRRLAPTDYPATRLASLDTTAARPLSGNQLIYRPYVRFTADVRRYLPLSSETVLALKGIAGWAHPIAGPDVVPFDRRFFSGGATSVRGWRLHELGPGGANLFQSSTGGGNANVLGGDIKLEASVELRTEVFQNFLTSRWLGVAFVDAGNVWFGPRNPGLRTAEGGRAEGRFQVPSFLTEVGVGGGIGVRLAWEYLIARFDLAYRLHDPSQRNNDVFGRGLERPLLHFGIGHTF